jgi:CBS domain-containing protein
MKTVRHVLQAKGRRVWSIAPDASVYEALQLMAEKEVGALLVLEQKKLAGIISERDYARKVILRGKSSLDTPVREIMTSKVISIHPDQTIEECMEVVTDKRIRHLPVLEEDEVVGLISIGDLVKAVIEEKDFLIQQLENYITGNR